MHLKFLRVGKLNAKQFHVSILNKFSLVGKVALVTGGASGIGESFAFALAEAGAHVAVADLNRSRAQHVANQIRNLGVDSLPLGVDVTQSQEIESMISNVLKKWGNLNIAVNNAGVALRARAEEMPVEYWDRTVDVDLKGVFFCCQAEARHMLLQGNGSIINTASMSAKIVNRPQRHVPYNAAKAGVVQLTRTCAAEWAERGVRVNSISPGHTLSPMTSRNLTDATVEMWLSNTPMRRLGLPSDLQGGLVFLASDASAYVTGHDLVIDGGYTIW